MLISILDYNVPTRYQTSSSSEFQQLLMTHDGMSEDIALDFTEQLLIFETCRNVYARDGFVQAKDVGQHIQSPQIVLHLLTVPDPPRLNLQSWSEFIRQHKLL